MVKVVWKTTSHALLLLCVCTLPLAAQQTPGVFVPPLGGGWEPVSSVGQPSRWKPFFTAGAGFERLGASEQAGLALGVGMYRDLFNPVLALLGVAGEVYAGQRGERLDSGARLQLVSPALYVRGGVDANVRLRSVDALFGVTIPPTRGGWFGQAGHIRVDWIPARGHTFVFGVEVPLGRPLAGKTRPRRIDSGLPLAGAPPPATIPQPQLLEAMRWITLLQTFAWRMGDGPLSRDGAVRHARASLAAFAADIDRHAQADAGETVYAAVIARYHDLLAAAFSSALTVNGDSPGGPAAVDDFAAARASAAGAAGAALTEQARRIVLEEVVLPYNRMVGEYRFPEALHGLSARARARFLALLLLEGLPDQAVEAATSLFDAWLANLELVRRELARDIRDSRMQWLPLSLVLRPDEHATQEQVDGLIELALRRPFTRGNATRYIDAVAFQEELTRTIHEAESYHVLWIHDFRGRNEAGDPDAIGFRQATDGYLRGLLHAIRDYDRSGRLPVYILLIDQHSYEEHDARIWLDLLERPLTHRLRLPARYRDVHATVAALQDSLRLAVAASQRLSADRAAFGEAWLANVVKVHVNVTYPSDPSFRVPGLFGNALDLFSADNLLRDHRKVVIRDVSEADPAAGEVILAGLGVGERYTTATWDDRAIVITGPGALEARHAAQRVLAEHGLGGRSAPAPLQPAPFAQDYGARVAALEARGQDARVLQVHNATGFGEKDATLVMLLLYDLAPAGTVIYVPDSLWLSFEALGQLMTAALRGCLVFLVAPSLDNAPNTGFPQLSRMHELITRAMLVQEQIGPAVRRGGGEFRVGLYARRAALDDVAGLVTELEATLDSVPFIADLFPLEPGTRAALRQLAAGFAAAGGGNDVQRPLLHRKTQLLVSRDALRTMAAAPGVDSLLADKLRARAAPPFVGSRPEAAAAELPMLFRSAAPPELRQSAVLYLLAGSMNMDPRSAALDGEATAVVAGDWALQAILDFLVLSGGVTWPADVVEAAALLPPRPVLQRWIGRVLHPVL